jgi:hypothetical protein
MADFKPGSIAVEHSDAAANGWSVGSSIWVRLPGGSRQMTVVAVYSSAYLFGSPLTSAWQTLSASGRSGVLQTERPAIHRWTGGLLDFQHHADWYVHHARYAIS